MVVHPSVYFVLDLYNRSGVGESLAAIADPLEAFRGSAFMKRRRDMLDPWIAESELGAMGRGTLKDCRVLVCGRAGVGKSTLINRVFGFPVVSSDTAVQSLSAITKSTADSGVLRRSWCP